MPPILRMTLRLSKRPEATGVDGVTVRNYLSENDMQGWINLRIAAFAGLIAADRAWTPEDFQREFLGKEWWLPKHMWFAEIEGNGEKTIVGTICLKLTTNAHNTSSSIRWLMVHPQHQQRGIGRLLLRTAEAAAWDAGFRQVSLETHQRWEAAVGLYRGCGYELL